MPSWPSFPGNLHRKNRDVAWWDNLVTLWVGIPMQFRLILLFFIGAVVGGQINRAVYRWTWHPKQYDPWTPPRPDAPKRYLFDKVPIFGWLGLARESKVHGTAHWVQPLLIELGCAFFFAWYYHWVIGENLVPPTVNVPLAATQSHAIYLQHMILIVFMTIATFVDFDSRTIPDYVTVPGFLIGLVLCWLLPFVGLPIPDGPNFFGLPDRPQLEAIPLHAAILSDWPKSWNGAGALAFALFLAAGWWFALCPKLVWWRGGVTKFVRYLFASFARYSLNWQYLVMLVLLLVFVGVAWSLGGPDVWRAVFTGLLGMAFAGMLIWLVRIFASAAMGQEAMGFGDVTLMCMIGVYIGWQPVMVIFFMAPFIACVFALINYLLTGDAYLAYGPYLCIGTLLTMIFWSPLWQHYGPLLSLGWILPALFLALPMVLGAMLMAWVWFKFRFIYPDEG